MNHIELKESIIAEYLSTGLSLRKLGNKHGVNFRNIHRWVMQYQGRMKKPAISKRVKPNPDLAQEVLPTDVKKLQAELRKALAILRYDIEDKYGPDGNNQPKRKIGKNLIGRYHYLNMVNIFTETNGTYYPSYIRSRFEHDEYNELKKITEKRSVLMRELIINKVNSDNPSKIGSKTEMKSVKLDNQLQKYDAEFWKNYNVLTRTPIQDEIIKELEKNGALEEQFNKQTDNSKKKN